MSYFSYLVFLFPLLGKTRYMYIGVGVVDSVIESHDKFSRQRWERERVKEGMFERETEERTEGAWFCTRNKTYYLLVTTSASVM